MGIHFSSAGAFGSFVRKADDPLFRFYFGGGSMSTSSTNSTSSTSSTNSLESLSSQTSGGVSSLIDLLTPVPLIQSTSTGGLEVGLGVKGLNAYLDLENGSAEVGVKSGSLYGDLGVDSQSGIYAEAGGENQIGIGGSLGLGGGLHYVNAPAYNTFAAAAAGLSDFRIDAGTSADTAKTLIDIPNVIGRGIVSLANGLIGSLASLGGGSSSASSTPTTSDTDTSAADAAAAVATPSA
jgi:hypothetical protein